MERVFSVGRAEAVVGDKLWRLEVQALLLFLPEGLGSFVAKLDGGEVGVTVPEVGIILLMVETRNLWRSEGGGVGGADESKYHMATLSKTFDLHLDHVANIEELVELLY